MERDLYAYTLRNQEPGWAWHVYDVEGLVVASGLERSQGEAANAIGRIIRRPPAQAQAAIARYA